MASNKLIKTRTNYFCQNSWRKLINRANQLIISLYFWFFTRLKEIEFYKEYIEELRDKVSQLQIEVDELKSDDRRKTKNQLFEQIYKKKEM